MIQYLFNKVRGTIINGLLGDKRFKCIQRRLNTLEEHCFYNSDDESEDDWFFFNYINYKHYIDIS